jgi:hypothetical protein
MTKEVQQKLIDDHFLFKEGDRFLQVGMNLEASSQKIISVVPYNNTNLGGRT